MELFSSKFNFNHLSVKDLVEARDLFHYHLINKKNVIATAVGRYRIRHDEPYPNQKEEYKESFVPKKKEARRLDNSEVREYSWPCVLVFVSEWEDPEDLYKGGSDNLVPGSIFMPDGRIIPICVIEAPKSVISDDIIENKNLFFPKNFVGGGFPLIINLQGVERVASIGCVVTDGNKYYALTNNHVTGTPYLPIKTNMQGEMVTIGQTSIKSLTKTSFQDIYTGWAGKNIIVNNDAGLVEIEDLNDWKTEIFGIGEMGEMVNLDTSNITLNLISSMQTENFQEIFPKVVAYGGVSGKIEGEIVGLFYRYKSLGGLEYVSDFLIGGTKGEQLNIHHGDSGTIWFIEKDNKSYPFALHWGQHNFLSKNKESAFPLGLASNLTNICKLLDLDLVRGWNVDNDYSWGKTGHYKIGAKSCELVSNTKLKKLLLANQSNIGITNNDLLQKIDPVNDFIPLADVADMVWRSTRKKDSTNHFCDIDESHPSVFNNKTLLELCLEDDDNIDVDVWLEYFKQLDVAAPIDEKRNGALPFRIWQMYEQMIQSLLNGNLEEFICAGGTMAHYVGDSCQPLHISHLHHGRNESEENVHSDYETKMLDRNMPKLFTGIDNQSTTVQNSELVGPSGKDAARRILQLMHKISINLPPVNICESFTEHFGKRNKFSLMWEDLGEQTIENMVDGAHVMAILWESAWQHGNGNAIASNKLVSLSRDALKNLYNTKTFVEAFRLREYKTLFLA